MLEVCNIGVLMYLFITILSVISCFVGFVLEVAQGNICHIQNGRIPNASASVFPTFPLIQLVYVVVTWVLNHLHQDLGFIIVIAYAFLSIGVRVFQCRNAIYQLRALTSEGS